MVSTRKSRNGRSKKDQKPAAKTIVIRGARVHNLKNVSLDIQRNTLVVVTGVSGSGKSSLAFDTIYAEGQRRFVESLSSYARQFLERMDKPDVDLIQGISPAVAIEQKTTGKNPRSTVGTSTEIYDYLRVLFARIGRTMCSNCGTVVRRDTVQTVIERLRFEAESAGDLKLYVLFPLPHHEHASLADEIDNLKKQGFFRFLHRDEILDLSQSSLPPKISRDDILVLVDRLVFRMEGDNGRLNDSVETAFRAGDGQAIVRLLHTSVNHKFSQNFSCATCGLQYEEPDPRLFSFNNPYGACPKCQGFGRSVSIDLDLVVPDRERTISEGAIHPWTFPKWNSYLRGLLDNAGADGIRVDVPFRELSTTEVSKIMNGTKRFDGINDFFKKIEQKGYKIYYRVFLSRYRGYTTCDACVGSRLRPAAMNVRVGEKTIHQIVSMTIEETAALFSELQLSVYEQDVARRVLYEIHRRLKYLVDVGIGYLTLDRLSATLSGGETQRIHLATALGSSLVGSLYVLDEPSIGLHPRDTHRLIAIMQSLRNTGNTVLVVEHDPEIMQQADSIIDMGPKAGELGGEILFHGTLDELKADASTLTGKYLSGELKIPVPSKRRTGKSPSVKILGAAEHNLRSIDVEIPLNRLVAITGVSGSGKSTLVHGILAPALKAMKGLGNEGVGKHRAIEGAEAIDNIELIDQSPIGRTPRSNPATYIKAFDAIRDLFAKTQAAKIHGYHPGYFSFNIPGGRCETCEGSGIQTVEMQFLADLELTCESCQGKRFKKEVLAITYHEKNIDQILNMTVTDALQFFGAFPDRRVVAKRLRVLDDIGMGYIRLGQSATTLSGGEAQRVKLASHLINHDEDRHTLFMFDEPTTGLHFADIGFLLKSFNALIDRGNSVLIIEHNMEIIKCADWVIDLGPEAGSGGGEVVGCGTPEAIARIEKSHTGRFLKKYL